MAKKVILKNNENVEILPITRGELVLDSSGNEAFHSNAFLATTSLPGLMSNNDKKKLDGLFNTEVDNALDFNSENPVQNKVVSTAIKNITDSYLKSADVNGNTLTITDQDDDTIDFFNTTYSFADGTDGSFTVTPSGGNAQTVKVGGILTDDKVKLTPSSDNKDYRVLFSYTDDDNTKTEGSRKSSKLKFNPSSGALTATTLIGKLDGTYVNKLTNYKKASEASDLAVTDSLNTALGKLEYKADTAFTFCNSIMGPDTDDVINKYDEIVNFIDSVKETEIDILDTFVTRKTTLTIDGTKTFSKIIKSTVTNSAPFSVASSTVVTNLNSDLLDGFEANTLFQSLSNVNTETNPNSISIKIGNTTKYLKVGYSDKVGSNFTLKVNSGTTEGTDKYTYNGSTAKTLNIKPGSNVSFSTSSGELTINSSYVNTTYSLSGALNSTNTAYITTLTPSTGNPTTATISKMVGATDSAAGKAGLVPKPDTGDVNSFLKGDGSWGTPVNTWRPITNEYDVTTSSDTTSLSQTGAKSLQRNVRSFKRFLGTATTGGYDLNTLTEGMVYNYGSTNYWKNGPSGMSYGRVLNLKDGSGGSIAGLLAWDTNHGSTTDTTRYLWWRVSDDGSFTEAKWHRIAYVDDIPSIKTLTFSAGTFAATTYNGSAAKTVNVPTTGAHIGLGNVLNTAFYKRSTTVNGTAWDMAGTVNSAAFTIYAPTTGGTSDYVLKSNGTSAPTWIALSSIAAGSAGYTYRLAASSISDVNSPNWQEPGIRVDIYNGSASNKPYSNNNANGVINFSFGKHGTTGHYGFLLAHGNQSNRLYFRQWTGGSREAWKTVAFTSDIPSIPSITATTTGSGNAITSVSASGHTITFTKGSTFLTAHQSLANCLRSTAWVSSPGQNANNMTNNTMNFTYSNNAPYTGPIIYFAGAAGGTYGMLMNATYSGGGYNLAFRTRNGDNGTWNSWHRLARAAEIPTKTSLLTNDSGFLTSRGYWANVAVSASSSTSTSPTFATATMTRGVVGGYNNTSYALSTATFICLSWVRTTGSTGWYNETYGGGWYMTDSTYVKVYNNKHIYTTGNSYVTSYYSKSVAVIGFCTNAEDWTGGAASSTVMGANYQTHVRSSGDNLYHYHWTNGANYKILDANNWSSVCNIGPSWESGGSVYCYGVSAGFYLYCRRYKLGSYYLINIYGDVSLTVYSDLDGGAAFYTSSSKSTKAQLPSGYRPSYGVSFAPWTGASGNENNRGFSLNIDSSGYLYYQGHADMPSAMGGTTVHINYMFIG